MSLERIAAMAVVGMAVPFTALADDNLGNIIQDGNSHSALILQTGKNNSAGDASNDIEQRGFANFLSLTQSGDENTAGLVGQGLFQSGTASTDGSASNSATIVQNSNGNAIGEMVQVNLGAHATTGNVLAITQDLSGDNTITSVVQTTGAGASSNTAEISQTGEWNWLDVLSQTTSSGQGDNEVLLDITGSYNGINGTSNGVGALRGLSLSSGAAASQIIQDSDISGGAGNRARLMIIGDYNRFGLTQYGVDNTVGTLVLRGSGNAIGSFQLGWNNQINPGDIVGDGNDLGIRQVGNANIVDVNIITDATYGPNNAVGIGQNGDANGAHVKVLGSTNIAGTSQLGTRHEATVDITGDRNVVLGVQINPGQTASIGNAMNVKITGDNINGMLGGSAAGFSGVALDLANLAPQVSAALIVAPDASLMLTPGGGGARLMPGLIVQWGEANDLSIVVGANGLSANDLFAVMQKGSRNRATATVDGMGNQFVILQAGDDNVAQLNQAGDYNVAAISQ